MQLVRTFAGCSVCLLALACFAGAAQSKLVRYEVDGQVYTYSTNNNQQVQRARRHMEEARLAEQAKAERAANPLAKLLSWKPRPEAAQPQPQLVQSLSEPEGPSATMAERGREGREEVRASRRRAAVEAAQRRRQVAEERKTRRELSERQVAERRVAQRRAARRQAAEVTEPARPQPASGTVVPDRTGSLGTKPSSYSSMVKDPADPQAYMMAFVERVRGKARPPGPLGPKARD